MENLYLIAGTAAYTLIAVRVAFVLHRAAKRRGLSERFTATLVGAMWPAMSVIYGFAVLVSGETGLYSNPERR